MDNKAEKKNVGASEGKGKKKKEGIVYLFTEIIKAVKSLIATLISIKFLE